MSAATAYVLEAVEQERLRQDKKWGEQNHPDGTGKRGTETSAELAKRLCDLAFATNKGTWRDILYEEVCEAFAETDPDRLRTELIQVAAVATAWVEAIDRKAK